MGLTSSKEQAVATALENQDTSELRTILKDLTSEQIRNLCKSFVPSDENQCTILHFATWQGRINFKFIFIVKIVSLIYRQSRIISTIIGLC
jgi:hypothetical protein